jgi:hypothetical protein
MLSVDAADYADAAAVFIAAISTIRRRCRHFHAIFSAIFAFHAHFIAAISPLSRHADFLSIAK